MARLLGFKKHTGMLNEILSGYEYQLPNDKKTRLYDFYMISWFNDPRARKLMDEDIKLAIEHTERELLPNLKTDLLEGLFYALAAEMRHIHDAIAVQNPEATSGGKPGAVLSYIEQVMDRDNYKAFAKYLREYYKFKNIDDSITDSILSRREKNFGAPHIDISKNKASYNASYRAAKKAYKGQEVNFALAASYIFHANTNLFRWNPQYGGEAWGQIADGFLRLYDADSFTSAGRDNLYIAIDHVYDLQHNNDVVFNKVQDYYDANGRITWLKQALDFKAHIKEPHELWPYISPQMQKLAAPAIKATRGKTIEDFAKEGGKVKEPRRKVSGGAQGEQEDHSSAAEALQTTHSTAMIEIDSQGKMHMLDTGTPVKDVRSMTEKGSIVITKHEKMFMFWINAQPKSKLPFIEIKSRLTNIVDASSFTIQEVKNDNHEKVFEDSSKSKLLGKLKSYEEKVDENAGDTLVSTPAKLIDETPGTIAIEHDGQLMNTPETPENVNNTANYWNNVNSKIQNGDIIIIILSNSSLEFRYNPNVVKEKPFKVAIGWNYSNIADFKIYEYESDSNISEMTLDTNKPNVFTKRINDIYTKIFASGPEDTSLKALPASVENPNKAMVLTPDGVRKIEPIHMVGIADMEDAGGIIVRSGNNPDVETLFIYIDPDKVTQDALEQALKYDYMKFDEYKIQKWAKGETIVTEENPQGVLNFLQGVMDSIKGESNKLDVTPDLLKNGESGVIMVNPLGVPEAPDTFGQQHNLANKGYAVIAASAETKNVTLKYSPNNVSKKVFDELKSWDYSAYENFKIKKVPEEEGQPETPEFEAQNPKAFVNRINVIETKVKEQLQQGGTAQTNIGELIEDNGERVKIKPNGKTEAISKYDYGTAGTDAIEIWFTKGQGLFVELTPDNVSQVALERLRTIVKENDYLVSGVNIIKKQGQKLIAHFSEPDKDAFLDFIGSPLQFDEDEE